MCDRWITEHSSISSQAVRCECIYIHINICACKIITSYQNPSYYTMPSLQTHRTCSMPSLQNPPHCTVPSLQNPSYDKCIEIIIVQISRIFLQSEPSIRIGTSLLILILFRSTSRPQHFICVLKSQSFQSNFRFALNLFLTTPYDSRCSFIFAHKQMPRFELL